VRQREQWQTLRNERRETPTSGSGSSGGSAHGNGTARRTHKQPRQNMSSQPALLRR